VFYRAQPGEPPRGYGREVPLTTKSMSRPPHLEQTNLSHQSRTGGPDTGQPSMHALGRACRYQHGSCRLLVLAPLRGRSTRSTSTGMHDAARDLDDAVLFAEQVERFDGLFGSAETSNSPRSPTRGQVGSYPPARARCRRCLALRLFARARLAARFIGAPRFLRGAAPQGRRLAGRNREPTQAAEP
jgi:hypothetical protein